MSNEDNELDRELQNLSEQLNDEKMDAIARRLGLRPEEKPRKTEDSVSCSFCGRSAGEAGPMVTNGAGAQICRQCLSDFARS